MSTTASPAEPDDLPQEVRTILRPGAVVTQAAWPDGPVRSIHVIRIGGAGMSAVARLALEAGLQVSGSDSQDGQFIGPLREAGAQIGIGFDETLLPPDVDVVVVSTAVRADNVEVLAAHRRGIPVVHRAAALAGLLQDRTVLAIAGTHGKTSTTAMAALALRGAGEDPAWALGAAVPDLGRNAGLSAAAGNPVGTPSSSRAAAVEADESDGSFLAFAPTALVVTNLEADHLDFHGDEPTLVAAFDALTRRLGPDGTLVVCADDPGAAALGERAGGGAARVQTYGRSAGADWRLLEEDTAPEGTHARLASPVGEIELDLHVTGHHNVLNAMGALAGAAALLGLAAPEQDHDAAGEEHDVEAAGTVRELAAGIGPFTGASRRFDLRGVAGGVPVFDDYAHHPREVEATIDAARGIVGPEGRVLVVFQPHLFSRTRNFAPEFAHALGRADESWVMPIYAAREDPDPTVTASTVTERAEAGALLHPLEDRSEVGPALASVARDGDVVLMLGAGDINEVTPDVLVALEEDR
ncbi:UDP-N-acetylmuramate--L-alanine ligase [Brachybacterium endophyticum]|uniref:UDP-N-acetylmuramate--L-alanine ligase n=1 Tax=Brachybacterium endophyticum TaxID=2182385 RepID=A0A2U2RLP4_9MICO|nr:UDP-N-acetylmuramate--L-alanine ligase [Brachybacterium endophyticum]PWH06793.1 UDP-N-acetylmuramate--L-alanine ligase [Brachybacterium endophyticum]